MTRHPFTVLLLALLLAQGCANAIDAEFDAADEGLDAGALDDAEREDEDSGPGPAVDSGSDEGDANVDTDSGPEDLDSDGVPDAEDCAPEDGSVGRTSARECANACATGTETCADGTWAMCDAPTDCLCDTPEATRAVDCGYCGVKTQRCTDGAWVDQTACFGSGECMAGATELREEPAYCRIEQRTCDGECQWGDWVTLTPPAECSPLVEGLCLDGMRRRCSAMCRYDGYEPC